MSQEMIPSEELSTTLEGLTAWLVTWERIGDHALPPRRLLVPDGEYGRVRELPRFIEAILLPTWPADLVRELVELLYVQTYTLAERVQYAREGRHVAYPAAFGSATMIDNGREVSVPWQGRITCGHNPWLYARLVDNLRYEGSDEEPDNDHELRWEERQPPVLQRHRPSTPHQMAVRLDSEPMTRRLRPGDEVWPDTQYAIDDPAHPFHDRYAYRFYGTADGWVYGLLDGDCSMHFVRVRPEQLAFVDPRDQFRVSGRLINRKNLGVGREIEENFFLWRRGLPPHLQVAGILYDPLLSALLPEEWRQELPPKPEER